MTKTLARFVPVIRGKITKQITDAILRGELPEVTIEKLCQEHGLLPSEARELWEDRSALSIEQLRERSRTLSKERHTDRGLMLARLEMIYQMAMQGGDVKTALSTLKEIRSLLDLNVQRKPKPSKRPIKTTASPVQTKDLSDEDLRQLAEGSEAQ